MPEVQEVFRMATQKVGPDPGFVDRQSEYRRKQQRRRQVGAIAVVAAIAVAMAFIIVETRSTSKHVPSDSSTPAPPGDQAAVGVARDFLGAFGSYDAQAAMTLTADDADLSELVDPQVSPDAHGLARMLSLLKAMGYHQAITECETTLVPSGTNVVCTLTFDAIRSDQVGRGPYPGNFSLTVRDGRITWASLAWDLDEFSPQMWEPFASWVETTYPDDYDLMYVDNGSNYRLSEESNRLWEKHSREYVRSFGTIKRASGRISEQAGDVRFSLDVPPFASDGWDQYGSISLNKSIVGPQGADAILFWTRFPRGETATSCPEVVNTSPGSTVTDVATAISAAPGTDLLAGPTDVSVGGRPAKYLKLIVRQDSGCDPGYFFTWEDIWWGPLWPETNVGDTIRVWVVDVPGDPLVIEAETNTDADAALKHELEQMVGSIRFL